MTKVRATIAAPQLSPTSVDGRDTLGEELDDPIRCVDQRLEDVGDDHAGVPLSPACLGIPSDGWPWSRKKRRFVDRVDAALAPGIAANQAPGGEHGAAQDSDLTHGVDRYVEQLGWYLQRCGNSGEIHR